MKPHVKARWLDGRWWWCIYVAGTLAEAYDNWGDAIDGASDILARGIRRGRWVKGLE